MTEYKYCNGKLFITLPEDFMDIEEDTLQFMFPYILKPNIVKADEEGCIFTMDYIGQRLEENEVFHAVYAMQRKINSLYPESIICKTQMAENSDTKAAWFAFKTCTFKGEKCHTMYAFSVDNNFMLGSFHWVMENQKELIALTKMFLENVKTLKKGQIYGKDTKIY